MTFSLRPDRAEIALAAQGVWRLAFFRKDWAGYFGQDITATIRSFWCAAIFAPVYFLLLNFNPADTPDAMVTGALRWVVELSVYAINWVYWPIAISFFVAKSPREKGYGHYITIYNWSVLHLACWWLLFLLGHYSGLLGADAFLFWAVVGFWWRTVFLWRVNRQILGASKMLTFGLLLADVLVSDLLALVKFALLY